MLFSVGVVGLILLVFGLFCWFILILIGCGFVFVCGLSVSCVSLVLLILVVLLCVLVIVIMGFVSFVGLIVLYMVMMFGV